MIRPPKDSVILREIKYQDELNTIYNEWHRLWEASADTTPFQSPGWLIPWWKYFGNEQLWTFALYNGKKLIGIAPLYIFNYRNDSQNAENTLRQVTFLGTGNTDYMDIICKPDFERASAEMIMEFLRECKDSWDVCDFQELRSTSPLLEINAPEGLEVRLSLSDVCPAAVLPESFDEYLSGLPVTFRKNTLRARRQLKDSGTLRLETADEEDLSEYLSWLFRLHNASWQNRNMPGLFGETTLQNFHKEAAGELLRKGILHLYVLKHNERIIAAVYALVSKKRLYYYIGGFEPEMAKFSPGSVCLLAVAEDAISKGIREFDFLRGKEKYKYQWKAEDRNNYRLYIK